VQPYIIKNFLDVNICNKVISFIEENDKQDNEMVKRRLLRFGIDVMNGNTDSLNSLKDFGQEIRTFANKAGMLAKILHNNNKEIFLSTLWLSKQLPGSSIIRHMDTDSGKGSHYIYSGVIYLNDQIFGGEIVFPKINFTYKPEAGDLVLFDCRDKDSQHGVNKTETMRYAIPVWFTDDPKFAMA
jgi:Rps23 Pro-64 3,4-dihydroxylase Tpa1-like proline 4-hydroxylase